MKRFLVTMIGFMSISAFAETGGTPTNLEAPLTAEQFLLKNYGWTFDTSKWKLQCMPLSAFPAAQVTKGGKDIETDVVCKQQEKSFWLGVVWHVPARTADEADAVTYWGISKPLKWHASWKSKPYPSVVATAGLLKDAIVRIDGVETQSGKKTFLTPVSFYHFTIPMTSGRSFIDFEGKKETNLAFTIVLQGELVGVDTSLDETWSKENIRNIVDSIRITEK